MWYSQKGETESGFPGVPAIEFMEKEIKVGEDFVEDESFWFVEYGGRRSEEPRSSVAL